MARRNSNVQIPGIDDRPMTKEQQDAMWERLAVQEEVFFGTGSPRKAGGADEAPPIDAKKSVAV